MLRIGDRIFKIVVGLVWDEPSEVWLDVTHANLDTCLFLVRGYGWRRRQNKDL